MEDPERLLGGAGGADELTLDVLRELRCVSAPREAKDQAWKAIATQIGAAAVVVSSTQVVATGASVSKGAAGLPGSLPPAAGAPVGMTMKAWFASGAAKLLVAVLVGGGAVGGALWVRHRSPLRDVSIVGNLAAPAVRAVGVEDHAAKVPEEDQADTTPVPTNPESAAPLAGATAVVNEPARGAAKSAHVDQLAVESALLKTARGDLRSGNARGAESALAESRARFPNGILADERTVLTVQVLAAEGNAAAAKRLASGFVATHPKSPYAATLKPLLGM